MSPFGFSGGSHWISKTLGPTACIVGGNMSSGTVSKVLTYTPSPTPHPSVKRNRSQNVHLYAAFNANVVR